MRSELNKELIESLNESSKEEFASNINEIVYSLVGTAVEEISQKSPFVRVEKCSLIPVNEVYLGAFCQQSEFTYFLGIDNPQIATNSRKMRNWWKYIWTEFKASWRIGRKKKYKKNKKGVEEKEITFDKYQLKDFKHDLVNKIAKQVTESSIVYEYRNSLSIIGNEDFGTGVKINIYVCAYDEKTNTYKILKNSRNKFVPFNFGQRYQNLDKKCEECGNMFVKMAKLLNILYAKKYKKSPNQIIVESLLYNCPNSLFGDDLFQTFVNVANFIRLMNPKRFVSICDEKTALFNDKIVSVTGATIDYSRLISVLDAFKY